MDNSPLHILLVEDNPGDARLVELQLEAASGPARSYAVQRASTVRQAVQALENGGFDAVLLDLSLPDSHGLTALTAVHDHAINLPIIVLSGQSDEDLAVQAVQGGAQDYLVKGHVDEHLLARSIRYAIERRQAENALQASERRFRALIENGQDQVSLVSIDGTLLWESPSVVRTLGYAPDQFVGQSVVQLAHPQDRARMQADLLALSQQPGERWAGTYRLQHSDGSWRWVEGVATNLLHDPAVGGIVLNYRDVTQRKQAQDQVIQSEERYRQLFENNPHPMWVYDPQTLKFLAVNDAAVEKYGYGREEFLGMTIEDIRPADELPRLRQILEQPRRALVHSDGVKHRLKDGTLIDAKVSSHTFEFDGSPSVLVLAQDVTAAKRAEDRVRYMTRLYATISQVNQTIVRLKDRDKLLQKICDVAVDYGEFGLAWIGLLAPETGHVTVVSHAGHNDGYVQALDINVFDEIGSRGPTGTALRTGQAVFVDDIATDPGFILWREDALKRGYRSYAAVPFRQNDVVIGNLALYATEPGFFNKEEMRLLEEIGEDISYALASMERDAALKESERRYRGVLSGMMEGCLIIDYDWRFIYVNEAAARQGRSQPQDLLMRTMMEVYPGIETTPLFETLTVCMQERRETRIETELAFPDGTSAWSELSIQPVPEGLFILSNDITDRKRAEEQRRASAVRFRQFFEQGLVGMTMSSPEKGFLAVNERLCDLLGYSRAELMAQTWDRLTHPDDLALDVENFNLLLKGEQDHYSLEKRFIHKDGHILHTRISVNAVRASDGRLEYCAALLEDISERKQAEEALRVENERFQRLVDSNIIGILIADPSGNIRMANDYYLKILGVSREEFQQGRVDWRKFTPPEWLPADERAIQQLRERGVCDPYEKEYQRADGTRVPVYLGDAVLPGPAVEIVAFVLDINERKQAERSIHQQLSRIAGLRDIDRAITSSFDLRVTMNTILAHVRQQLAAEAAAVSILDSQLGTLTCVAATGMHSDQLSNAAVRLGHGLAGTAAMQYHTVHHSNLQQMLGSGPEMQRLLESGITNYYGVPLISKGQVKGILEVFHRSELPGGGDGLEYLETLAGQAAIAVDNIQMLEGLNRSNLELVLAYDATIEGWSRALDMRDRETEGHTQRVTELTLRLAGSFGFSDKQLSSLRWGALLHDIGKLGVPDSVLLKPGALTPEEWVLMKKHPELAYQMLSPIQYLHGALDIPLCHHEKWDGTGYPRGLKGEQIPLAARLFAIVDIWDALRSDRPYRAAWPEEKVLEYIKGLSGTHLDPQVVNEFFAHHAYQLQGLADQRQ